MSAETVWLGDWAKPDYYKREKETALINDFQITAETLAQYKLLIAFYNVDGYEGEAYCLLKKSNRFYEVFASHCSCYGLEGQFEPELTTKKAILYRLEHGTGQYNYVYDSLEEFRGFDQLKQLRYYIKKVLTK